MTKNLETAFTKFFREKTGFPNFKSTKNLIQSFPIPQHYTVDFEKGIVKLPKRGEVKAVLHKYFDGTLELQQYQDHPLKNTILVFLLMMVKIFQLNENSLN
jgi:hypothetical protein